MAILRDPGSPKLRMVSWNLNTMAFQVGDEGHPNHHQLRVSFLSVRLEGLQLKTGLEWPLIAGFRRGIMAGWMPKRWLIHSLKLTAILPLKMDEVGILLSYWDDLFSGAMLLVSGRVGFMAFTLIPRAEMIQIWLFPWRIHGTNGIFTDPWVVDFYGKLVGKYTSPMDAMGIAFFTLPKFNSSFTPWRSYYLIRDKNRKTLVYHFFTLFQGRAVKLDGCNVFVEMACFNHQLIDFGILLEDSGSWDCMWYLEILVWYVSPITVQKTNIESATDIPCFLRWDEGNSFSRGPFSGLSPFVFGRYIRKIMVWTDAASINLVSTGTQGFQVVGASSVRVSQFPSRL